MKRVADALALGTARVPNATHTIKSGSVSLAAARQAARAAKARRHSKPATAAGTLYRDSMWERYLGHFGPVAKKSSSKKAASTVRKMVAKKAHDGKVASPTRNDSNALVRVGGHAGSTR